MPKDWKIVVLIDEDRADCLSLKEQMETAAADAGLITKSAANGGAFTVLNRIVVEELEAWFFGDVVALQSAYPRVPKLLDKSRKFRNPDAISNAWESLEGVFQKVGYCRGGLPKIEVARKISQYMDPNRNTSKSFQVFRDALQGLMT